MDRYCLCWVIESWGVIVVKYVGCVGDVGFIGVNILCDCFMVLIFDMVNCYVFGFMV